MHFSLGVTYRNSSKPIHWGLNCAMQTCHSWHTTSKKVSNCRIPKLKKLKETTPNLSLYNSTIRKDIRRKWWLFEFYNQTEQQPAKCNCWDFSICYGTKIRPFWSFCRASKSLETSHSSIYIKPKQVWQHNDSEIMQNSGDVLPPVSTSYQYLHLAIHKPITLTQSICIAVGMPCTSEVVFPLTYWILKITTIH